MPDGRCERRQYGTAARHDRARRRDHRRACAQREGRGERRDLRSRSSDRACDHHRAFGRPCPSGRRARPRQDEARRHHGRRARARRKAHPVHPRPDAVRHSRQRGAGGKPRRQAQLPVHSGPGLRAASDGRRDQPRQPAHAIRAPPGDAGAACHGRRRAPRSAEAVPRARDAESAGTGGDLSPAGSAARPLPHGDRRRLSRHRGGTADPIRYDRSGRDQAEAGHDVRRPDLGAAAGAPAARGRVGDRGDSDAGALGAAGLRGRRRPADRLGSESAREPGADARGARARAARRTLRALDRRRRRARRARPETSHGPHFCRARRRRDRSRRDRPRSRRGSDSAHGGVPRVAA